MEIKSFVDEDKKLLFMCKDEALFSFTLTNYQVKSIDEIYNRHLLPEMLKGLNVNIFTLWLVKRQLDTSRSNARLLLKLLGLDDQGDLKPILFNKGLCLTDHYWLKEYNSKETYSDVKLSRKHYLKQISETSLSGVLHELPKVINPEITNTGSFNKAWVYENDTWYLYKAGTKLNQYAELMTYRLGTLMGMKMTEYCYETHYVKSKLLIDSDTFLESYASFCFRFSDREYDDEICYNNIKSISQQMANEYLDILLLDGIVCNPDRHEENWGVIKDVNTGRIISLAPNFDNNLAFNSEIENSFSLFLLKLYLKTFGIQPHQIKYIQKLTKPAVKALHDNLIKEMRLFSTTMDFYLQKLYEVIDYISTSY